MTSIDLPRGHALNVWLLYWPVTACPMVVFATWNGPPGVALLFALVVMRDHRQWQGLWSPIICFIVTFGCIVASGISAALRLF